MEQAPVGTMIKELGVAIAEAQFRMDQTAIRIAQMLGDEASKVEIAGQRRSLLELGFTPTFYQITEATVEAKVSITSTSSTSVSVGGSATAGFAFFAASVNASYSQKYSYSATGSSSIVARFVSVPPPSPFTEVLNSTRGTTSDDTP